MQRMYPCTIGEYITNHEVLKIINKRTTLWTSEDGEISTSLKKCIIKEVRGTTILI